ncbi:MAG: hypothetical protein MK441_12500, partial [SAR324 cluster bacterium]|nr:hypothetical protein [SAR324 cluster bacterium]
MKTIEQELGEKTQKKTEWSARHATFENQIAKLNIEIEESLNRLNELREDIHKLTSHISNTEQTITFKKEQQAEAREDIEAATEEIARMKEEVEVLSNQTGEEKRKLGETSSEINDQEVALDQLKEQSEQKRDALQAIQDRVQAGERKVFELFQQSAGSKNKLTELKTKCQGIESRKQNLLKEKEGILNLIHDNQSTLQERERKHQISLDALQKLKEQQENLKQKALEGSNQAQVQADAHGERKEIYFNKASLLNSLEKLRKQFEGFNEGIKSLMSQQNGERIPGIREVLVDVLQTSAEYETAIETALGDKLQSVIVNSYSDSMEAIGYLKNNESGRGLFVPLNPKSTPSAPLNLNGTQGVVGRALNFINCSEDYRPVIELLLGNVVIVQDMDVAMHLHQNPDFHGTVVTLNGEMIEANGFVTGGSAKSESSRLLARNREIESLSENVKELKVELEESQVKIESDKRALAELEADLRHMDEEVHQKELDNNNSLRDLEQLRQEVKRLESQALNLDAETTSLTEQLQGLENEKGSFNERLLEMEQKSRAEEEMLVKERTVLEESRQALEDKSLEISSLK